jgi:replicative superfamily II helicase
MNEERHTSGPALLAEEVRELLEAQGLLDVVSGARRLAIVEEITRLQAADRDDEQTTWRLAQALERLALEVQEGAGRRRLFDQAYLCRRALPEFEDESQRLVHLVCFIADALGAERRAELIMQLRERPSETLEVSADHGWDEEVLLRIARAFALMARRSGGWDDIRAAADEVTRLRELHRGREELAAGARGSVGSLSRLIALYNLARMVELCAEYLVSGSPSDVGVRLARHHANVQEIDDLEPDPTLAHLADLLHLGLQALVTGSVWTATRGLGARIGAFVEALTDAERANPVLELWPSQRSALRSSLLDPAKRALVIQMPTSAGKTLVAEFAVVQALALNPDATVAYVVPTRALVNQITLRLRADLAALGLQVEAAVPVFELDPVEDGLLRGERIHVLVTTPEKLDLLLRQDHPTAGNLALVVADEAHNIGEGERGARLELMLGTVKRERPDARFLLLSPFVPNAADLAGWLGDDPGASVEVDWQPTELVTATAEWVKPRNRPFDLQLTTVPSARLLGLGQDVKLSMGRSQVQAPARSKPAIATSSALRLSERGSVLVLCRGRGTAESRAAGVAAEREDRGLSPLGEAVVAYAESELGREHPLPGQLRRGVAYHHAGLSHDLRYLVERLIDLEDVDVVCGTTTLAQGVNFPIANVVVETLKQRTDGPEVWRDLTFAEFWNIAGRAGRALRDRMGLVVYPVTSSAQSEEFRDFLARDSRALASALIEAFERVDVAATRFDLAFVRNHRTMAIFTQYLTHALRVGGYDNARADVEDLLRSSLAFYQTQASDPQMARGLIALARRYLDSTAEKGGGYLRLADGTGFSLASVDLLYAQQRGEHREFERRTFWEPSGLFAADRRNLTDLIAVLGDVPELSLGHREAGPFNPEVVAGVVGDWVGGRTVAEIADRWFLTAEPDPDKRRRLAGHYLYSRLVGQVPWGMGAVQRLALSDEDDLQAVGHVPSLVFYGVRSREAAALRMAGVPRVAAEGLARQWREEQPADVAGFDGMREWLSSRPADQWQSAMPQDSPLNGPGCRRVWAELAGAPLPEAEPATAA